MDGVLAAHALSPRSVPRQLAWGSVEDDMGALLRGILILPRCLTSFLPRLPVPVLTRTLCVGTSSGAGYAPQPTRQKRADHMARQRSGAPSTSRFATIQLRRDARNENVRSVHDGPNKLLSIRQRAFSMLGVLECFSGPSWRCFNGF